MSDSRVWAATISRRPLSVTGRSPPSGQGSGWSLRPSSHHNPPMTVHRITLIPGDGAGPELVDAARVAIEATGVGIEWDVQPAGLSVVEAEGTPLPPRVIESIRSNRVALKGPLATQAGFRSVNVRLRVALGLYAAVRPCRLYAGVRSRYERADVVVVRELTEGSYTGIELEQGAPQTAELIAFIERTTGKRVRQDSGLSIKAISDSGSRRIARFAFEYARANGRRKVTAGHKANIMKFSDGLLLPNLYGDILSDLCAGIVGGLGVAPGVNLGDAVAVFEATHGTASRYRGLHRANPMALMLCGSMLLRHIGETAAGDRLEAAVAAVIAEGRTVTYDLRPTRDDPNAASTTQVRDAVAENLLSR